jgi:hypothetical protein
MSTLCTIGCDPTAIVYNPQQSSKSNLAAPEEFEEVYGSADLKGYNYTDLVCLEPINGTDEGYPCVNNFNFMAISFNQGLN